MIPTDFDAGAWAMVAYIYNTSGEQFVADVYESTAHPNYLAEKANAWAKSPTRAIGALDVHRIRILLRAVRKYETALGDIVR
jgi:hypothetical protein